MAILELVLLGLARWLRIDWLFWDSDSGLVATVADERRQRQHDRQWARGFLAEKRLEREQQALRREARVSRFVNRPLEIGRLGSRRTP